MPVSIVVGGQYGSEGKGKVALELARQDPSITTVVRPGGTNSGHTGYSRSGQRHVLRQLPAAAIDRNVRVVFPAGSYIDTDLLLKEIVEIGLSESQVVIDPRAHIIRPEHIAWEADADLVGSIGSTMSGTGAAVLSRVARFAPQHPRAMMASEVSELARYVKRVDRLLTDCLKGQERILVEGTQGFGLSVLHSESWPKCTSRDTTAAGFLSEVGLSPLHVDRIYLVLRCHPIRVAGDSGPLTHETNWHDIAISAGACENLTELTSVTKKVRRVGCFDAGVVRRAMKANSPTAVVLNHLDYIDWECRDNLITDKAKSFVEGVQKIIGRRIDYVGTNEFGMVEQDFTALTDA